MGNAQDAAPIMLRASITPDEHRRLRTIAAQTNAAQQDLVAKALRQAYDLSGTQKGESK